MNKLNWVSTIPFIVIGFTARFVKEVNDMDWRDIVIYISLPIIAGLLWAGYQDFASVKDRQIQILQSVTKLDANVTLLKDRVDEHLRSSK